MPKTIFSAQNLLNPLHNHQSICKRTSRCHASSPRRSTPCVCIQFHTILLEKESTALGWIRKTLNISSAYSQPWRVLPSNKLNTIKKDRGNHAICRYRCPFLWLPHRSNSYAPWICRYKDCKYKGGNEQAFWDSTWQTTRVMDYMNHFHLLCFPCHFPSARWSSTSQAATIPSCL